MYIEKEKIEKENTRDSLTAVFVSITWCQLKREELSKQHNLLVKISVYKVNGRGMYKLPASKVFYIYVILFSWQINIILRR